LFAHLYIFIIFLSQLIREKSGKVGQNGWNRCNYWVSAGPVLKIKVGQNPKKVGQNLFRPDKYQASPKQKWAKPIFVLTKVGQKKEPLLSSSLSSKYKSY
jgi:hypothetical protein